MTPMRVVCRVGAAAAVCGAAFLPLVDLTPDNWERVLAVIAVVCAAVLLGSIPWRQCPPWAVDAAATVAAFLLFTDGWESILAHEQRDPSIWRTVLLTWAGATMALVVMLDVHRGPRREDVTT